MREFTSPPITTKGNIGPVSLAYAFQLKAKLDPRKVEKTAHGGRVFEGFAGGTISGPGLTGEVYPDSGGNHGVVRASDRVEDLYARFMVKAANGEWLYFSHVGYRRPDGYFRIQAYFDADSGGPYAWLNDAVMIGTAEASPDGRDVTITYYQAL